jgi:MFS family permease
MSTLDEYAAKLLTEAREELTRADAKASILFAAFGVVVAAVLAGLISSDWAPTDLAKTETVIFWIGTALAVLAFVALSYTLWPRIEHKELKEAVSYYGHVRAYRKEDRVALRKALERGSLSDRAIDQLVVISDIVWSKFIGIRWAIVLFGAGAVLCAVAVIVG